MILFPLRQHRQQVTNVDENGNVIGVSTTPTNITFSDTASLDGFGRLRVSQPVNRFDAQLTYNLQPLLYEQLTSGSGAAIAHDATNRCAILTLADSPTGSYSYMQSYEWFFYQPGNSQLIEPTFNFNGHTANVTKFVGYGDRQNNGIHFISDGSNLAWRILSNTDNGDETVLQSAPWNLDTLDGSGDANNPSGIELDITKTQICVIDLQALYVGRVRVGFNIDGITIYCHEFRHANRVTDPYIQIASLPVICGMECSATASATMEFICATVKSEGGTTAEIGANFAVEGTVTAASGARTHILSVRPKTTFNSIENRTTFIPESLDVLVTGNNPVLVEIAIGQAITGTTTFNNINATYSAFEFNTAGTISGSPSIVSGALYVPATNQSKGAINRNSANRYPITLNAAGAVRALGTFSILVTGIGGTSATRVTLNYRELR